MATHDLKTWPVYFRAILDGTKRFEIRRNDRNFALGDLLYLREYEPVANRYTDRTITVRVAYMMDGGQMGLLPGFVIMSIDPIFVPAAPVAPVPAALPAIEPRLRLTCRAIVINAVMQVIEDERGERHQLTGEEMSDLLMERGSEAVGWQGTILFFATTRRAHFERNERCTVCQVFTPDWVDPDYHEAGRICRPCEARLYPGE